MDLRSDHLYWPAVSARPRLSRRGGRSIRVGALIVGTGVTGALTAYELTRHGVAVALLDRRPVSHGSTPASTALLQYELDVPLITLTEKLGKRHARAAYAASFRALGQLGRLARTLGTGVAPATRPSLYLGGPDDRSWLIREAAARREIGIDVRCIERMVLRRRFSVDRPVALCSRGALELNPLQLTYEALSAAVSAGALLLPRGVLPLSCGARGGPPFEFQMGSRQINADRLIIATGYETPEQFPEVATRTQLRSTFALATQRVRGTPWPDRALIWETGDPYFYARTTADGRVICGGGDVPFTTARRRDALIPQKTSELLRRLQALVPQRRWRAGFRWAGTFAQTSDGLPYIGPHGAYPGVHFALGYGGNGITFAMLAADIISAAIRGEQHSDAKLFSFERSPA